MEAIGNFFVGIWRFIKGQSTICGYFLLAIIVFGGLGVTIPYIIDSSDTKGNNQNLITYYLALFAAAWLDLVLIILEKDSIYKKASVIWLLLLILAFSVVSGFFLKYNLAPAGISSTWVIVFTIFSWLFWYGVHYKDSALKPTSTLGGNTSNPVTNR